MNSINVNVPIVNIPHVTQHQQDIHRAPMVHQTQNADLNRDRFDRQLHIANEAEQLEEKIIDPKDRKEEEGKKKKKGRDNNEAEAADEPEESASATISNSGLLIDLEA